MRNSLDVRYPIGVNIGKAFARVFTFRGLKGSDENAIRFEQIIDRRSFSEELGI
jgi:hypothetical protein